MGSGENQVLVIETDGSIEPIGSLKVCGNGFTKIGANVLTHSLDEALGNDLAALFYSSGDVLCATCRECALHEVCGGGYLPMRYSTDRGFDNPSAYCGDLMKLITHIQNRVVGELSEEQRIRLGLHCISYAEARELVAH
jgi:uncharacterized protein